MEMLFRIVSLFVGIDAYRIDHAELSFCWLLAGPEYRSCCP